MTTRLVLVAAAAALALAIGGCGAKREAAAPPRPEPFNLVLDFFPNADHVGIYAGLADGDFRHEGLDLRPRAPSDPAAPLKLLAAGRADLAISYEPELLLARDRGLKLVSVGAIVQRPLTSVIALPPAGVRRPADLQGKRVGTAGIPYQSAYLRTILDRARVSPSSVRQTDVGFNLVPALLSRKVDAILGGFWNYEGIQLAQQRRNPVVIPVDRAGVPTYDELIVVAREQDARERGGRIRRFMRALTAGYQAARRDPGLAVAQLVRANRDLDPRLQLASVRATLPAFFPTDARRPFGYQDPGQWASYGAWMLRNQLIRQPPSTGRAFTNEFLPGQGV
ncbi:MAG TPA: ABC transporter substrate-binding protein [Solirubrobacteraceae bacterium]|nr:ABC transporter substrate-binding protein [Solirubrobacteraceae bacterium]